MFALRFLIYRRELTRIEESSPGDREESSPVKFRTKTKKKGAHGWGEGRERSLPHPKYRRAT